MVVKETKVMSPVSLKSNHSDRSGPIIPSATYITVASDSPRPGMTKHERLRLPRSLQLQLARSVTFGVLGEDSQLYPSSRWASENRNQFSDRKPERPQSKSDFVITSLDTRKHNPQTTQIFHIKRINKKPVCSVQSSFESGKFADEVKDGPSSSVYAVSYTEYEGGDSHIHRLEKQPAEGIVPINDKADQFDVRTEMMLPVCDSTIIPSAHNPHRYLLRKRKVPPPYTMSPRPNPVTHEGTGIVYPNLEKPRMVAFHPDQVPTSELPFINEQITPLGPPPPTPGKQDRISVSSLAGQDFSRRKCIHPPQGHIAVEYLVPRRPSPICVSSLAGKKFTRRRDLHPQECEINLGFNGGVGPTTSSRFDDRYLPFIRAKTII